MKKITAYNFANPYLPLWEHLPDGEPRVFEDPDNPGKFRAYVIGSHDVRFGSYCGPDIRAWSAPVEDLNDWRDEGAIFTYEIEGQWDVMYAPDLVELKRKDGTKEYYLYPNCRGRFRDAMVCKGPSPVGPFKAINMTEDGTRTVPGSIMGFDPAVFVEYITDPKDPDYEIGFRAYGYWGFQKSHAAELDQNTMYSLRPGTEVIHFFLPSSSTYGVIRDPEGTEYPSVYPGEDLARFNFYEAASIRKIGNKYVWVYSGYSGPDYGLSSTNSALRYAYGDTLLGPWKSGGVLVDSRAPVLNRDGTSLESSYSGHNTHGSIELINGQWYAFYHRAPRGYGYARQPMAAPVHVSWDEKPVAEGGSVIIRAFDPYAEGNIWTAKAGEHEYTGAEVTSEGFNIYGLDPYRYYSAGIACYLSNEKIQADSFDIWDDHMPLTGVSSGDIIGYKYFDFRNVRPGTKFNLFLAAKTNSSFKINIWLNGPWDNDAWKGIKLGEIIVPEGSLEDDIGEDTLDEDIYGSVMRYTLDLSSAASGLDKKHAIFLAAEGTEGELCDISGLGFSSDDIKITCPLVPFVKIFADGTELELPSVPLRSTNANGITGYDTYEVKYSSRNIPVISASIGFSSNHIKAKDVIITIAQADAFNRTAIVKFDYAGVVKTYRIVLAV